MGLSSPLQRLSLDDGYLLTQPYPSPPSLSFGCPPSPLGGPVLAPALPPASSVRSCGASRRRSAPAPRWRGCRLCRVRTLFPLPTQYLLFPLIRLALLPCTKRHARPVSRPDSDAVGHRSSFPRRPSGAGLVFVSRAWWHRLGGERTTHALGEGAVVFVLLVAGCFSWLFPCLWVGPVRSSGGTRGFCPYFFLCGRCLLGSFPGFFSGPARVPLVPWSASFGRRFRPSLLLTCGAGVLPFGPPIRFGAFSGSRFLLFVSYRLAASPFLSPFSLLSRRGLFPSCLGGLLFFSFFSFFWVSSGAFHKGGGAWVRGACSLLAGVRGCLLRGSPGGSQEGRWAAGRGPPSFLFVGGGAFLSCRV